MIIEIKEKKREFEKINVKPNINNFKETDFSLKHKKVKDRVLSLLKLDEYARENDFYLCLLYWVKCGYIKTNIDFNNFHKITKPESISRCRRELTTEARKGNKELQFLLKNKKLLNKREDYRIKYNDYYKKNEM